MIATIISALILIVCLLLMLFVLVQNPKGGGLATGFGSAANQMMGARRGADFMEKGTWILAAALLVLSVASSSGLGKGDQAAANNTTTSTTQDKVNQFQGKGLQNPNFATPQVTQPANGGNAAPPAGTQPAPATGATSPK